MKNKLTTNKILNIVTLFFGGLYGIPGLAIVCLVILDECHPHTRFFSCELG